MLDSGEATSRSGTLVSEDFSISVTVDSAAGDSSDVASVSLTGYRPRIVASISHPTDPEEANKTPARFRRPVKPGVTSLTGHNFRWDTSRHLPTILRPFVARTVRRGMNRAASIWKPDSASDFVVSSCEPSAGNGRVPLVVCSGCQTDLRRTVSRCAHSGFGAR